MEEEEELIEHIAKIREEVNSGEEDDCLDEEIKFDPRNDEGLASGTTLPSSLSSKSCFSCKLCPKEFARLDHLSRHEVTVHAGSRKHPCRLCTRVFDRKDKLKHHLLRIHDIGSILDKAAASIFRCSCGEEFEQELDFDEHRTANPRHERVAARELTAAEAAVEAERIAAAIAGDEVDVDEDVKFEIAETDIKQEPGESIGAVEKTEAGAAGAAKFAGKKRGRRPARKATRKPAASSSKKDSKTYLCKYCKEGFTSISKRKQHYLDAHWSELKDKGLLFTHNNALRQGLVREHRVLVL